LEALREHHRQDRFEKYKEREEMYLAQRKKRIAAVKAEEDAKPVRKAAFLQQRATYRALLLRKKYNAQQEWEVLEARRLNAEQRREEIRNEELYNRIEHTRSAEEREKFAHRTQRERTLKDRRAKEQEALEQAREAAQIQARLEAKRAEAHQAYNGRVREKAAEYCERIRSEVEQEKLEAAVTAARLADARKENEQAMILAWRKKKEKEQHDLELVEKRKQRIALRDLEMSREEAADAHAANAQADRRAEVISLAKAAKVESLKSEARVKQEQVTVRRRLRGELDEKREANIAAREAAREEREKARIIAETMAIKAAKEADKAKKERLRAQGPDLRVVRAWPV
jgi:colicin import membrane protein